MKVIIRLLDGRRFEMEADDRLVRRGKLQFAYEDIVPAEPWPATFPESVPIRHCRRVESENGVPVFVEE